MTTRGVRIEGVSRAVRNLAFIGKRAKVAIGKSVRAGGTVLAKATRQEAPKKNGHLRRSIIAVQRRRSEVISSFIGQDKAKARKQAKGRTRRSGGISGRGDTVPIHLVDQPTKAHEVQGRPWLAFEGRVIRRIRHPGTHGRNFVLRAANKAEKRAVARFVDKLETEVAAEVAKVSIT